MGEALPVTATPVIRAVKRQGRMMVLDHTTLARQIESFREGERLRLTVKRDAARVTISDPLRRYYWAVVATMIAEETGHSKDMVHEALKRKILGYIDERTGLEMVPSVFGDESALTVTEKRAFVDEVRRWAFDFLNIAIPDPESIIY